MNLKIILMVSSFAISLVVAEIGARIVLPLPISLQPPQTVDSRLGPIPVPYQHGRITVPNVADYTYTYTNNSLGLRGSSEYGPKTKPRILLVGDSFTYGLGVNDDQTFAHVLQSKLPAYEVINGGNPDKGTDYALKFYETFAHQLQPDIVILSFCENDFQDNQRHWYFDDNLRAVPLPYAVTNPNHRAIPLRSWLVDHVRLIYMLKTVLVRTSSRLNEDLTGRYLKALRDQVQRDGARFLVFRIASLTQPDGTEEQKALSRLSETCNLPITTYPTPAYDYLPEGHWNARGHADVAAFLASKIQ